MPAYALIVIVSLSGAPDPATVPPQERIAYVNKLADRLTGINASKEYAKAAESYVGLMVLPINAPDETAWEAYHHVDDHQYVLERVERWSPEEARVIREWIKANEQTLRLLKRATKRGRFLQPLDPDGGRLHSVLLDTLDPGLMRCSALMRIVANDFALRGKWNRAYEWNLRAHTVADHVYQQPTLLNRLVAYAIERASCQQLLAFLHRRSPKDTQALLGKIEAGDESRCPEHIVLEVEALCTRDYIECWHEWAQDHQKHPGLTGMAESYVGEDGLFDELGDVVDLSDLMGNSPFESVEALRKALRASSVEKEWAIALRVDALTSKWCALPFHEAWKKAGAFEREYCDILLKAPSLAVAGCGQLASSQPHLLWAETSAHRAAVSCVVAILEFRAKENRLPKRLDELVPQFPKSAAIDPYSGRPFVYRVNQDGTDFVLYSVGSDQDDDGGVHTDELRSPGDRVFWPPPVVAIEPD